MRNAEKVKRELASCIGCHPDELSGENIKQALRDAERYFGGFQVLWAAVDATIGDEEVFPS